MEMTLSMTEFLSMQAPSRDPFSVGPREHLNQMISMVAMSRNGDHRFLPLLMNKVNEVLPRIANPMLQNAPENSNMGNVDIFDGFGNAGMGQPPSTQMHLDFDRKFPVEDYDKKYNLELNGGTPESASNSNHSGSPTSLHHHGSDLSYGGSPGMEYSHNMNGFGCQPMPDMVMHQMGNPTQTSQMNAPQSQHQHQHSHHLSPQHLSPSHDGSVSHHGHGISPQSIRSQGIGATPLSGSHPMSFRPVGQSQEGFRMQAPPQLQPLGDFNTLPRTSADGNNPLMGMAAIGGDLDFGSIR